VASIQTDFHDALMILLIHVQVQMHLAR